MKRKSILIALAGLLVAATAAYGIYYDVTGTRYLVRGLADLVEQSSAPGTPDSGTGRLYVKDNGGTMTLYFKDDAGTANSLLAGTATALDDIGDPDANTAIDLTNYYMTLDSGDTDHDMFEFQATGAFGNVSAMLIEQKTGDPTDGTLFELKLADTDPDFVSFATSGVEKVNIADDGTITLSAGNLVLTAGDATIGGALSVTGAATLAAVSSETITLENGLTIDNASNNVLELNENSEELKLTFEANSIDVSSTSGVASISMFDGASSAITKAADGAGDDFTLSVTGAQDSSLILASSGTGADAMQLTTTAGGIDITITGGAAGEDIDLTTDTSINLTATENAASAITLTTNGGAAETMVLTNTQGTGDAAIDVNATAGGFDLDAAKSITLTSAENTADSIVLSSTVGGIDITAAGAGAGEDIDISATGSSVNITATEADAAAIVLNASTALGGIDITSNADIDITTTGAAGEDITLTNTGGSIILEATEAATDAIVINASTAAGGIDITSQEDIDITTTGAAGEDISITNTGGSVIISATEDIADGVTVSATGGIDVTATGAADKDLDLTCTSGSANLSGGEAAADAVTITAGAGGVDITSAATFDIDLTATGGTVQVVASEAAANQFKVDAQGTIAGDAIVLETTDGGILLNADNAANGDIGINADDDITITAGGDLTLAVTGTVSAGGSAVTNVLMDSETVTAANVLTSAECGKVMFLSSGAEFATTLPAVTGTAGCEFDFYIAAAPVGANYTIVTDSSENTIVGGVVERETDDTEDGPYLAAADTITFVQALSVVGDYVHFMSDGTTWFMTGQVNADDALTVTQASP